MMTPLHRSEKPHWVLIYSQAVVGHRICRNSQKSKLVWSVLYPQEEILWLGHWRGSHPSSELCQDGLYPGHSAGAWTTPQVQKYALPPGLYLCMKNHLSTTTSTASINVGRKIRGTTKWQWQVIFTVNLLHRKQCSKCLYVKYNIIFELFFEIDCIVIISSFYWCKTKARKTYVICPMSKWQSWNLNLNSESHTRVLCFTERTRSQERDFSMGRREVL